MKYWELFKENFLRELKRGFAYGLGQAFGWITNGLIIWILWWSFK